MNGLTAMKDLGQPLNTPTEGRWCLTHPVKAFVEVTRQ